jgi:hypothetical protein
LGGGGLFRLACLQQPPPPGGQGKRGGGGGQNASALGRSGVAETCGSKRRSRVECTRGHRLASSGAGSALTRHPLTPSSNTPPRATQGGDSGAGRATLTRASRGVKHNSASTGGSIHAPCADRADQTRCAAATSGDHAQGGSRRCLHACTNFKALKTPNR